MSNSILAEIQANKLATLANDIPGGYVSVMFDLDQEDESGSKQKVLELAKCCRVRLAWTTNLLDGQFRNWQPESMTVEDWDTMLRPALMHVS